MLAPNNDILWRRMPLVRFKRGKTVLEPRLFVLCDDTTPTPSIDAIVARVKKWWDIYAAEHLAGLYNLTSIGHDNLPAHPELVEGLPPKESLAMVRQAHHEQRVGGAVRGLVYRLQENLGCMMAAPAADLTKDMTKEERKMLRDHGIEVGYKVIYIDNLYAPRTTKLRQLLWEAFNQKQTALGNIAGKIMVPFSSDPTIAERQALQACGFLTLGRIVLRADKAEDISINLLRALKSQDAVPFGKLTKQLPMNAEQFRQIAKGLGFAVKMEGETVRVVALRRKSENNDKKKNPGDLKHSPFAALADLDAE